MAKRWICLWAALVLALMGVCLCVAVWDGVAWARTGEFQLLPALNVTRFRSDGSLDEEDAQALTGASSFLDELYETGHDERDPLRKFVNVSTWLALLDLPFFYCGSWRAPAARGKVARALCTGIALLLVAVARFCARGCYGGFIIEMCYSAAFIEPRALFLPIAALLALTLIARLCRER